MSTKEHWEHVYATKSTDAVSWFQEHATQSLELILASGVERSAPIIDVGAGASVLVDELLDRGFSDITLLDISATALDITQRRLGERATMVRYVVADVISADLPVNTYAVWHDRAVFHFLTTDAERHAYVDVVRRSVRPGGHVIMASFAEEGPEKCSGLPVTRYSPEALHEQFGDGFEFRSAQTEEHRTPFGTIQQFMYCYCRKK